MNSPSKYRAKRTEGYASKREAIRASELELLEKIGKISHLVKQPRYLLVPKDGTERAIYYVADFRYWDVESGMQVVEDVKGYRTQLYRLKRRLLKNLYGIDVVEV